MNLHAVIRKTREPVIDDDFYLGRPWRVTCGQATFFFRSFDQAIQFVKGWRK